MNAKQRSNLAIGLLFVLVGLFFLVAQFWPELHLWTAWLDWPIYGVGLGVFLLLFGLLVGEAGMAVPACVVMGISGILYWQNLSGDWASWSYLWTLIPGFVSLGEVLSGLLGPRVRRREKVKSGAQTLLFSVVLFFVFGSFFGAFHLGPYWPILLIVLGVLLLLRALFRGRQTSSQ
ncbi:MAG: hypothetical protein ACP5HM_08930 [Anaerolineae bacterium]